MTAPSSGTITSTWGYHPALNDIEHIVLTGSFRELLIFGQRVPDVVDLVTEARRTAPPTALPTGVYWFSGLERPIVLAVYEGSPAAPGQSVPWDEVADGSALDNALGWAEEAWATAPAR